MTEKDDRFKNITLDSYLAYFMLDKCDIIRVNLLKIFPSVGSNFKIMLTGTIKDNKFLVDGMINGTEVLTKDVAQDRVLEAKHEYEEVVVELPENIIDKYGIADETVRVYMLNKVLFGRTGSIRLYDKSCDKLDKIVYVHISEINKGTTNEF